MYMISIAKNQLGEKREKMFESVAGIWEAGHVPKDQQLVRSALKYGAIYILHFICRLVKQT